MDRKEIVAFFICEKCGNKVGLYGPIPIVEMTKVLQNVRCYVCLEKIENVTAVN